MNTMLHTASTVSGSEKIYISDTRAQDVAFEVQRSKWRIAAFGLLVVACLAGVAFSYSRMSQIFSADQIVYQQDLMLATLKRGDITREILARGRIIAANSPTLFSNDAGTINLKVKAGDRVAKDEVLAVIMSSELKQQYDQALSELQSLKVALAREGILAKRSAAELQQMLDVAEVEYKANQRERRRADRAREFNLISELDYETAEDNLLRAALYLKQAKQNNTLESEIKAFELETLSLRVGDQERAVSHLQDRLSSLNVRSPADGLVGNVLVEQGQAVADSQALISVVDLSAYEIEANIQEGYSDELRPLLDAEIKLNGEQYQGRVLAISPEVTNAQVSVRIGFSGELPKKLRQNQAVSLRVLLEDKKDVLVSERGSIVESFDGYLFKKDGDYLHKVAVTLGARNLNMIEISSGLAEGDVIAISRMDIRPETEKVLIKN